MGTSASSVSSLTRLNCLQKSPIAFALPCDNEDKGEGVYTQVMTRQEFSSSSPLTTVKIHLDLTALLNGVLLHSPLFQLTSVFFVSVPHSSMWTLYMHCMAPESIHTSSKGCY